jgi:hypothetical protein
METSVPSRAPQPPSKRQLAVATGIAFIAAVVILVTVVLPAEYGIDPLGTGAALGLDLLAPPAVAKEEPAPPAGAPLTPTQEGPVANYSAAYKSDAVEFTLGPYEYVEYKYDLEKGASLLYCWTASAPVIQEFYGDEAGSDGQHPQSYEKSQKRRASGALVAPFSGIHGWYWENPGADTITIKVTSAGFYRSAIEFRIDGTRQTHEIATLPPAAKAEN